MRDRNSGDDRGREVDKDGLVGNAGSRNVEHASEHGAARVSSINSSILPYEARCSVTPKRTHLALLRR
jgi:hypothetical protein